MSKYTIYLRRNKVNGKCYVGQTIDFRRREWQWHCLKWMYANEHLSNDRAKYGLDNWTVEVLAEADKREEAWELEQRFIRDIGTLWPKGYNLSDGGIGPNGCKRSDEYKQKKSKIMKKQVYQYTLDNKLVKIWPSTMECDGYNQGAVAACCRKCYRKEGNDIYKGYRWSFTPL